MKNSNRKSSPLVSVKDRPSLEQVSATGKAQGYAEALDDLTAALRTCNTFALVSIEPAVRQLQRKAKRYSDSVSA